MALDYGIAVDPNQERKNRINTAAPNTTDYDFELKRIDEELDKRMRADAMIDQDLVQAAKIYGDSGVSDEISWYYNAIHEFGPNENAYNAWREYSQPRASQLRSKLNAEAAELKRRKQATMESAINAKLASVKAQEEAYKSQLLQQQDQYGSAVDNMLSMQLEETGYGAGQMRGQTAAAFADRGLGRSTMNASALGDITLQEQESKAGLRTSALQTKERLKEGVHGTIKSIEDQREKLETNRNLAELSNITDEVFQKDASDIQNFFENQINEMKMEAEKKNRWIKIGAGILGTGAKIFFGGGF